MDAAGGPHNRGGALLGANAKAAIWNGKGAEIGLFFAGFNSDGSSARPGLTPLPPRMDDYRFRFNPLDRILFNQQG